MSLLAQDERLTRKVGAITLLLLGAAIAFFVFIAPRLEWGRHVRIAVYFHHTGGLHEGAPFVVGGAAVGRIESIALSPRGAPGPLHGDEGVIATVAIDASAAAEISRGGDIFVASRGPLSDRYLELASPPAPGIRFREGDAELGIDPPSMDRVLQRMWDNLTTAARFFAEVRPEFELLRTRIATLADTLATLLPDVPGVAALVIDVGALRDEARRTWDVGLGGGAGVDRIAGLIAHAQVVARTVRAQLAALGTRAEALQVALAASRGRLDPGAARIADQLALAIDRAQAAIATIDPLLAQVAAVNERLARGEGSIGKLMHDPEFPEDAKELGKILKRQPWKVIARPHD